MVDERTVTIVISRPRIIRRRKIRRRIIDKIRIIQGYGVPRGRCLRLVVLVPLQRRRRRLEVVEMVRIRMEMLRGRNALLLVVGRWRRSIIVVRRIIIIMRRRHVVVTPVARSSRRSSSRWGGARRLRNHHVSESWLSSTVVQKFYRRPAFVV